MQAALAEDTTILQDLINKLEETEKVLSETEKANQVKRKVILDRNHLPPKTTAVKTVLTSAPTIPTVTRPQFAPGGLPTKNVSVRVKFLLARSFSDKFSTTNI